MTRIRRLRRRPDFLAAASGRRFHTARMTTQARLREPGEMRDGALAEGLHVGLTITKRVGHATERNRIRRRLRGVLDALADGAPEACAPEICADVVLIARRPALDAPFDVLVDDLRRALASVTRQRSARGTQEARGAKDTRLSESGAKGDTASGACPQTEAHVPRRASPGGRSGHGRGRGTGKGAGKSAANSTAHGTTDG